MSFSSKDSGGDCGHLSPTLRSGNAANSAANGGVPPAVFWDVSPAVTSKWAKGYGGPAGDEAQNLVGHRIRRLTPRECERLQGFSDDYTQVAYRGKPAADAPRYKAIGNSMAVPVMRWIGQRIAQVDELVEQHG